MSESTTTASLYKRLKDLLDRLEAERPNLHLLNKEDRLLAELILLKKDRLLKAVMVQGDEIEDDAGIL